MAPGTDQSNSTGGLPIGLIRYLNLQPDLKFFNSVGQFKTQLTIPDVELNDQTPPQSQPVEPLSPLSYAQSPFLSQLFSPSFSPSSPSLTPLSLPVKSPLTPHVDQPL